MFLAYYSIEEVFGRRRRNLVKMTKLTNDPPVTYDVMIANNIIRNTYNDLLNVKKYY